MADAEWDLGAEIDRLYGLPPEDFVGEREALARRLRAERRRDEAKEVHALRKPSRAAWAINRVVREHPELATDAVSAGDALREAHLALASGGGPDALRAAANAQRSAVDRFSQVARETLSREGLAEEDTLRRISETLFAAATNPDLGERVGTGRVVKEQAPVGFGPLLAAFAPVERPPAAKKSKLAKSAVRSEEQAAGRPDALAGKATDDQEGRRAEARARAAAVEDARRRVEVQARMREARASEARAHEESAQLEADLDKAGERRSHAREELDRARREVDEAKRETTDLERALGHAREEAVRASALLEELEAEATE